MVVLNSQPNSIQKQNEKIGLVINTPNPAISLGELDQIFGEAASTGIGRSNVYLFWNIIEPEKGKFDWNQSDILMSLNKKNNLKVTLFFSIINGETLGPFPNCIGNPSLSTIQEEKLVNVIDAILSRYDIIDTVIIAGETESQFRYNEQNIPVYKDLFNPVYEQLKEKHPEIKIGNAFSLNNVINKNLKHIVKDLIMGDFVSFSYSPVDSLNEISKNPENAKNDLDEIFEIVPDKSIGLFEISWSTSDFVGGNDSDQRIFLEKSFQFFSDNESKIEFFNWFRQYDKPVGTCAIENSKIGGENIEVGATLSLGTSEHVIERLDNYLCHSGLIDIDGNPKQSWKEFKNQIESIN
jgi:hypothetical protein